MISLYLCIEFLMKEKAVIEKIFGAGLDKTKESSYKVSRSSQVPKIESDRYLPRETSLI